MRADGQLVRALEGQADLASIRVIDQTELPSRLVWKTLRTRDEVAHAIEQMVVRGAPLIGVAGAFGLALALREDPSDAGLRDSAALLRATRPTAVNLAWGLERISAKVASLPPAQRAAAAYALASVLAEQEVAACRAIGTHALPLFEDAWAKKGKAGRLNVLTHCNAGWLATVDWGTALAPIFLAHERGLPVHVWVDETRPRNQGYLTAWELRQQGVPHTVIVDNAGGYLMRRGQVDLCIVGTDRTAGNGDVCNKIGTYLKALAAKDNGVPFYVAAPTSSIDRTLASGDQVVIEERSSKEVTHVQEHQLFTGSAVSNPGFDVTPARLITALVTEKGVCAASEAGLTGLLGAAAA